MEGRQGAAGVVVSARPGCLLYPLNLMQELSILRGFASDRGSQAGERLSSAPPPQS